jgi:hypothetical protein
MSGRTIPYQLRQNKSIDRFAFIELLQRINRFFSVKDYRYVSFGGYTLEDFKLIHSHLGISKMTSIEISENVLKRQHFNVPLNCIELRLQNSKDFISSLLVGGEEEAMIVWLDYTEPKEIRSQLEDIQSLIPKLKKGDILKVTLNANPSALNADSSDRSQLHQNRYNLLREKVGDAAIATSNSSEMITAEYPRVLKKIVDYYIGEGLSGTKDNYFVPLTSFTYADGQQMFTLTGIILDKTINESDFLSKCGLDNWSLAYSKLKVVQQIDIPDLTLRERLFVDSKLPKSSALEIQKALGYEVGENTKESIRMLEMYTQFYRHVIPLSKILI